MAEPKKYTRADLINALVAEYDWLCQEDPPKGDEPTPEEYREELQDYSYEKLIEETGTDDNYPLDDFMENYGD
jgi:hypothetical protein